MTYQTRVGQTLAASIAAEFGPERTTSGQPSEWDFWSGPLAAALIGFRDFDNLLFDDHPEIRQLHIVDPVLGAIVFVGVRTDPETVELAAYAIDRDYWDLIDDDPIG